MTDDLEREWEELDPERSQQNRRHPFPSLSETENRLIMLTMKQMIANAVTEGFTTFQRENCEKHQVRTKAVEVSLYGDNDHRGLIGRVRDHDDILKKMTADIEWSKRLIYTALVTGLISILVAFVIR